MHGDEWLFIILGLIFLALIVSPVLAIVAFRAVRRLEAQLASKRAQGFASGEPLSPQMMDPGLVGRVYALEQKLAQIEALLSKLSPGAMPAQEAHATKPAPPPPVERPAPPPGTMLTPAPAAPPVAPPARPATPPVEPPRAAAPVISSPQASRPYKPEEAADSWASMDFEKLIAGRWLLWVGGFLILIGVGYFHIYAFDSEWVGPTGKVSIGFMWGTVGLGLSHWLLKRGYKYFSEVITALGAGLYYLSLYAAWNLFHLIPNSVAFLLMIGVTAAMLTIAVGRESQRLAVLGLVGGFLTPMLVSTGRNAQIELFSYVAALDIGLLVITRLRGWRWLEPLAFVCTQLYFWGWYDRFYHTEPQLLPTMIFAGVFFVIFAVLPAIRSQRTAEILPEQMVVMLTNAFIYLLALRAMLWPDYRWTLTIAVLVLSAMHLGITRFIPRGSGETEGKGSFVFLLYAGLALTFATLAIPIRLEGKWITMAWAIEGAVLIWSGFRARLWLLRAAGLILFGVTVVRLVFYAIPAETFLLNARFGVYLVTMACFTAALWFARENREHFVEQETAAYGALGFALNAVTFTALSQELWLYFSPVRYATYTLQLEATRLLAMSAFWAMYAAALFAGGVRWQMQRVRLQGYILLIFVGMKLIFADLGESADVHFAWPLLNARFVSFAIVIAAMLVMIWLGRKNREELADQENKIIKALGVFCNLLAVVALSVEVVDYFQPPACEPYDRDTRLAQQLGLSLLWTFYAGALMAGGVRQRAKELRYQALVLLGVTIVKVFFFDLGFLSGFYRIVSSLGLGVVLLVVAFLYQRFVTTAEEAPPEGSSQ